MNDELLRADRLACRLGKLLVIRDISFRLRESEILVVVGPSGCGKTTLLNVLAGHLPSCAGSIRRSGGVRVIYQDCGLFPWLNVVENVTMGLPGGMTRSEGRQRVQQSLAQVGLTEFSDEYPHRLSRGMRQRVELARAFVGEASILLMDEPFSALDYLTRMRLRDDLVGCLKRYRTAVVLVTHDLDEAAQLADHILVVSPRPARVLGEITLTAQRPRNPSSTLVTSASARLRTMVESAPDDHAFAGSWSPIESDAVAASANWEGR